METVRVAVCVPAVAITVYVPDRSATNRPSASIWAGAPAATMAGAVSPPTANRTGTPGTSRPPASAATAVKRSTSPVRAMSVPTARTSEVTGFSTTSIVMASRSAATAAVTVTVPVSSKARKPNRSRVATAGSLVPNVTGTSSLRAPTVSVTATSRRGRVPA